MKKWFIAVVFGGLLLVSACGGNGEDATSEADREEPVEKVDEGEAGVVDGDVTEVEELFKSSCVSCHSGEYALVPNESDLSLEEMEDIILNGVGNMPAIDVTDEEATLIAQYLVKE